MTPSPPLFGSNRSDVNRTPNAWALAVDRDQRRGRALLDLTLSNPTRAGITYPSAAFRAPLAAPYLPAPLGQEAARRAVTMDLGVPEALERTVLTSSTSEAYAFLFKLLCDPGDEILVPAPSYPLLDMLARYESVRLVPYPLIFDGTWHVDLDAVRNAKGPRTRGLVLIHPNNPTGSHVKETEVSALASLGLPLIADEVFLPYPLVGEPRASLGSMLGDRVLSFCLGGLSKRVGLPGMKLSWMIVGGPPREQQEALARLELIADAFLSVGDPVQRAAPDLLREGPAIRQRIQKRTATNLSVLREHLQDSTLTLRPPEAGWVAVVQLPATHSEEQWVLSFLEAGVVVQPGWLYDFATEPFIVLSLLPEEETFAEGVSRLLSRPPC